jgi:hypothetical protein
LAEGENEILMPLATCRDGAHPSLLRIKQCCARTGCAVILIERDLVGFGLKDFAG